MDQTINQPTFIDNEEEAEFWRRTTHFIKKEIINKHYLPETLRLCYELQLETKATIAQRIKRLPQKQYSSQIKTNIFMYQFLNYNNPSFKKRKFIKPFEQYLQKKIRKLQTQLHHKIKAERAALKLNEHLTDQLCSHIHTYAQQRNIINKIPAHTHQYTITFNEIEADNTISPIYTQYLIKIYDYLMELELLRKHRISAQYGPGCVSDITILDKELLPIFKQSSLKPCPPDPKNPHQLQFKGSENILQMLNNIITLIQVDNCKSNFIQWLTKLPENYPQICEALSVTNFQAPFQYQKIGTFYNHIVDIESMIYSRNITQTPIIQALPKNKKGRP